MIEYKRRMHKYEKIPTLNLSHLDFENIKKIKINESKVTANKLRYTKIHYRGYDEIIMKNLKKNITDQKRNNEIIKNVKKIKDSNNYELLFSFLSTSVGSDGITLLIKKLKIMNTYFYKDILKHLGEEYNDIFMDNALLALDYEFDESDISKEIIDILKTNLIRDPLDFSSLLMILGRSLKIENINILYSFYIYFKDNFPNEDYFEGPLIAMKDILNKLDCA